MAQGLHGPWIATALNTAMSSLKAKLWVGGTINPDPQFMSGVDGSEASTTNYTSGFAGTAIALSGLGVTYDSANNRIVLAGTLGSFTNIGVPAGYTVNLLRIYIPVTSYADSPCIASYELNAGSTLSLNGGNLTITANATGLGIITV